MPGKLSERSIERGYKANESVPSNLCLNNQRLNNQVYQALVPYQLVTQRNHDVNAHAKLTLIETMTSRNKPTKVTQDILRKRKNFRIITLASLQPQGLNQELNP